MRAGGHLDLDDVLECGYLECRPERGQWSRHVKRCDQVVAFTDEALVGTHPHEHIEVASGSPSLAGMPATAHANPLAVIDPRGNRDLLIALHRELPATATCAARLGRYTSVAMTDVAEAGAHHLTEGSAHYALNLAYPLTARTALDRGAGLGAVAVTVIAAVDRLVGDIEFGAD